MEGGDKDRVAETTPLLEAALRSGEGIFPEQAARDFLVAMRRARHSDLIERIASAVLGSGIERPFMQIALARAQVDRGEMTAALSVLQSLLPSLKTATPDQIDARLLIGRICMDLYLDSKEPSAASSVRNLERAINEFYDVYRFDPSEHVWAGCNVFALLRRAESDGVRLEAAPDAGQIAQDVLAAVSAPHAREAMAPWRAATAIEACLALDRREDAVHWADSMLSKVGVASFVSAAVERQLVRMWRLSIDKEPGATLLAALRGAALADRSLLSPVPWDPNSADSGNQPDLLGLLQPSINALRSTTGAQRNSPRRWCGPWALEALGQRASSSPAPRSIPGWVGGNVLMTATHVFGASPPTDAADLADWRIEFVGAKTGPKSPVTGIRELLFCSPMDQLDVVVMRLEEFGLDLEPLEVAAAMPEADGGARIGCIGPFWCRLRISRSWPAS